MFTVCESGGIKVAQMLRTVSHIDSRFKSPEKPVYFPKQTSSGLDFYRSEVPFQGERKRTAATVFISSLFLIEFPGFEKPPPVLV